MVNTQGFVMQVTPHGETSAVVRIFTRQLGLRSYIVKGCRGGGARCRAKMALLQPMTLLDMVVYDTAGHDLNYIKEMSAVARELSPLAATGAPQAVLFFVAEALGKTLHHGDVQPQLFDFVALTLQQVMAEERSLARYPIVFLLGLADSLGILPLDNYTAHCSRFDIAQGLFAAPDNLTPQLSSYYSEMLHHYLLLQAGGAEQQADEAYPLADRLALIDILVAYFQHHLASFKDFKSHQVLHTILG